jgi:hypothetical protein
VRGCFWIEVKLSETEAKFVSLQSKKQSGLFRLFCFEAKQ